MEIEFTETALRDLDFWKRSGNKVIQKKISTLLSSIQQDPYQGIGKPEPLKHQLSGYWSRRINKEHRLVYHPSESKVVIVALRFHY